MHVVREGPHYFEQLEFAAKRCVQFHASQKQLQAAIAPGGDFVSQAP